MNARLGVLRFASLTPYGFAAGRRPAPRGPSLTLRVSLGAGARAGRPGVVTGMLKREPPAVMKSVFRSSPPKAQLVVSSRGMGMNSSSSPSGEKT